MEDVVLSFISSHYHPDTVDDLFRIMRLFETFNYDAQPALIDVVVATSDHSPEESCDAFMSVILKGMAVIFNAHQLNVDLDTPISKLYEILYGLDMIQSLIDYSGIIALLDAYEDADITMAEILAQIIPLSVPEIMDIVHVDDPSVLDLLRQYIDRQTSDTPSEVIDLEDRQVILGNYRLFKTYIKDRSCLGSRLIESNVLLNQPVSTYLMFDRPDRDDRQQYVLDVISVLYLTKAGVTSIIPTFRKYSRLFTDDLNQTSWLDAEIIGFVGLFERFKQTQSGAA